MNILDIGSGPHPINNATHRMDLHLWPGVTHIHDMTNIPYPFENDFFDMIHAGDVLEHISKFDLDNVLHEVHRILKKDKPLIITVPDAQWLFERIIKDDWFEKANVDWLNPTDDSWENAMAYLFGGFHNKSEYTIPGMGHINAFNEKYLIKILTRNNFYNCKRMIDERNPEPARNAILKIVCLKGE